MTDCTKLVELMRAIAVKMQQEKEYLTELDNQIGDGDHGINLSRGFTAVLQKLEDIAAQDAGVILKSVGMTLVSTVGGASGPLYGTAFMKAGACVTGKTALDGRDFMVMLDAAILGIQSRGKAVEGEKTMLDALMPAYRALKTAYEATGDFKSALDSGIAAARAGVEYTKTIIATKGRASYLGERSIGHQDPGATSSALMLETIRAGL